MPFLSSSTALAVYTISDPANVTQEKLRRFAFRPIDDLPETRGLGWASIEDMFDVEWRNSVPEKGEFVCFSLRVDSRKVAASVLKKHLADALRDEEAKCAAEGRTISRARKKELKEIHASKLLHKAEPTPASIDVAVDMTSGLAFVSSVSSSLLDVFEQRFIQTFGTKLERVLFDPPKADLLSIIFEQGLSPTVAGHHFQIEEAGHASLVNVETGATVTARDEPESVVKALQTGLTLSRLKIRITRADDEALSWTLTLSATGDITGLKTPKVEASSDEDLDAPLLEKLYLLGQVVGVIREIAKA